MLNKKYVSLNIEQPAQIAFARLAVLTKLIKALNLPDPHSTEKYFLGITGIPGSGKTTLTKELSDILTGQGYNVIVIKQDDFRIAKNERYLAVGQQKHKDLPLVNQWHNWKDMLNIVTSIKASEGENSFNAMVYKPSDGDRIEIKPYYVRGTGDIILIDGAFILNVGDNNLYEVPSEAIKEQLNNHVFIFRGSSGRIMAEYIFEPIFQREQKEHPEKTPEDNKKRASYLANMFMEDIKSGLPFWQQANILLDNTRISAPGFVIP